jgi:hypothetical protein
MDNAKPSPEDSPLPEAIEARELPHLPHDGGCDNQA